MVGHRGAPTDEPENTISAFLHAVEQGADGVELDVQLLTDGQLAVYHDTTVELNGLRREVRTLTLEELRASHPHHAEPERRVPTLHEVLELDLPLLNIELKTFSGRGTGLEKLTVDEIRLSGRRDRVLVSSFNPLALFRIRQHDPTLDIGLLTAPDLPRPLSHTWLLPLLGGRAAVHPRHDMVTAGYPPLRSGRRVHAWTVNDVSEACRLAALGVHAIITDLPGVIRSALG